MKIKKMLLNSIVRCSRMLGVDISEGFLRLVGLSFNGNRFCVESCVSLDLHDKSSEAIAETLRILTKKIKVKTNLVATSFKQSNVFFKDIDVASGLSSKELKDFLQFTLVKDVGGEILFDYKVVDRSRDVDKLKVVAAKHEGVEKKIDLFKRADLRLRIIDVDVFAIKRVLDHQLGKLEDLVCVVIVGGSQILILVFDKGNIVYLHEEFVNVNEMKFLAQVVKYLNLKLDAVKERLSQEICQVVLAGESESLFSLAKVVSQLDIKTIVANPFFNMDISPDIDVEVVQDLAPKMLVSCGLALRVKDGWR